MQFAQIAAPKDMEKADEMERELNHLQCVDFLPVPSSWNRNFFTSVALRRWSIQASNFFWRGRIQDTL